MPSELTPSADTSISGVKSPNKSGVAAFQAMTLFSTTAFNMTLPTIYLFANQLGASVEEIGLIATVTSLTRLVLRVPIGIASDRFGGRFLMQVGCVLVSASLALLYLAMNPVHVMIGALINTIGSTLIFSVGLTVAAGIYRSSPEVGVSFFLLVCSTSFFIAPLLCSILLLAVSIRDTYLVASAIGLIGIAASGLVLKSARTTKSIRIKQSLASILRNRTQVDALLMQVAFSAIFVVLFVFFPLYSAGELGLSSSEISGLFSIYSFAMVVMRLVLPRLMVRIGDRTLMFVSFLDFVALMILLPFIRNLIVLSLVMFVSGLGHGVIFADIAAVVARASKPTELGLANALNMGIGDLVGIVGPVPITVIITSFGFNALFFTLAAAMAIVAFYVATLAKL